MANVNYSIGIIKATKKVVVMFGMNVEIYHLGDGRYTMSKTQVAQVIEKWDSSVQEWLRGKSPEAAPYKDLSFQEISTEGRNTTFHSVPFEVAVAYWLYWARQGNEIAMAIMANCTVEKMNRLADEAFGLVKQESDYTSDFESRQPNMEAMATVVNMLTALTEKLQNVETDLARMNAADIELRELKSKGVQHPGCLGVLEHDAEFPLNQYITAREYLEEKGIPEWSLSNTFSRRSAQAMRVGKNLCNLPMHKGQVIYSPDNVAYLEETFKSMMGL